MGRAFKYRARRCDAFARVTGKIKKSDLLSEQQTISPGRRPLAKKQKTNAWWIKIQQVGAPEL